MLCCDELADTIFDHGYCKDQIFNACKTSLNHKTLPCKTFAVEMDREAHGAKKCKECVTVLTYTNGSGLFQLPLLVTYWKIGETSCFEKL